MSTTSRAPLVATVNPDTDIAYRGALNFNEGAITADGTFVPRYWGLKRTDGFVFDSHTFRALTPLEPWERGHLEAA